jgi:hypothetical protein
MRFIKEKGMIGWCLASINILHDVIFLAHGTEETEQIYLFMCLHIKCSSHTQTPVRTYCKIHCVEDKIGDNANSNKTNRRQCDKKVHVSVV